MNKANTYLILFPPVSYTLSYLRCGRQVTTSLRITWNPLYYRLDYLPYLVFLKSFQDKSEFMLLIEILY